MKLPALAGVTKNIGKLRLPSVSRKLESITKDFPQVGLSDLQGLSKEDTGFSGSLTKVAKIEVPSVQERESEIFREDIGAFEAKLEEVFQERGII